MAELLAVVALIAFGPASVGGVNCGPYFKDTSLACATTCERVNGSGPVTATEPGPLVFAGSLSCFCGQDLANGGRPTCNVTAPWLFAGGVPEFNELREGDWLRSVRVSGITELWTVHRWAFLRVSSSLRTLELTDNAISFIENGAFSQLHALTLLNLSGNRLGGDWPLRLPSGSDTPRLRTLDLSRNLIHSLRLNSFACLTNLRDLHLDANPLLHIADSAAWQQGPTWHLMLPSLRTLSLAYSGGGGVGAGTGGLTALLTCDYVTFCRFLQLERLSLAGTRWSCGCGARWAWLAYYGGACRAIDAQADKPRCYAVDDQNDGDDGGQPLAQANFTGCPAPPDGDEIQSLCRLGWAACAPVVVRPLVEEQNRSTVQWTTPNATVTVPVAICGGTLVNRAQVTSPSFPLLYPSNVHCTWRLLATVDHLVRIRFDSFATEKAFDVVTIVNGTLNDPTALRLTYSGTGHYNTLTLGREVTMTFSSDAAVVDRGFQIDFSSVPRHGRREDDLNVAAEVPRSDFVTDCEGNFTGQAVFASPGFPVLYPNHLVCKWNLRADAGQVVHLDFPMFSLENEFDYLEVYDGDLAADPGDFSFRYTGSGFVEPLRLGPVVSVVFSTDYSGQSNGFLARFTSVPRDRVLDAAAVMASSNFSGCGGVIIDSGTFTSPGYPVAYPRETNCLWVLRAASPRHLVQLEFVRVALESSRDLIKIFDVDSRIKTRHFSSFSGVGRRRPQVYGRQVAVVFTADSAVELQGFQAIFSSEVNPNAQNATSVTPRVRLRMSFTSSSVAFTSSVPTWTIEAGSSSTRLAMTTASTLAGTTAAGLVSLISLREISSTKISSAALLLTTATASAGYTSKEPPHVKVLTTVEDSSASSSTTTTTTTEDGTSAAASSIAATTTSVGYMLASAKITTINADGSSTVLLPTKATLTADNLVPAWSTAGITAVDVPLTATSTEVTTTADGGTTGPTATMTTTADGHLTPSSTVVTKAVGGPCTASSTEVTTAANGRASAPLATVTTTADGPSTASSTTVTTTAGGPSIASSIEVSTTGDGRTSASSTTVISTAEGTSTESSLAPSTATVDSTSSGSITTAVSGNVYSTSTVASPRNVITSAKDSLMVQSSTTVVTTVEGPLRTLLHTTGTTISETPFTLLLPTLLITTNVEGQTTASLPSKVTTTFEGTSAEQSPIAATTSVGVVPMKGSVVAKGASTTPSPVTVTPTADRVMFTSPGTDTAPVKEPSSMSSHTAATAAANCSFATFPSSTATVNANGTLLALVLKSATTAAPEAFAMSSPSIATAKPSIADDTWTLSSVTHTPETQGPINPGVTVVGLIHELMTKVAGGSSPRRSMSAASNAASGGEHTTASALTGSPFSRTTKTASGASLFHATTQGALPELSTPGGASSSSSSSSSSVAVFSKFLTSLAWTHRETGATVSTVIATHDGVSPVTTADARQLWTTTTGVASSGTGCHPSFSIGNLVLVSAFVPPTLRLAMM